MGALNGWVMAASAISLATPSAQVQQPAEPAQTRIAQIYPYQPPAYAVPQTSPWEIHKIRLAALARQQRVRESTIQAVVPYLRPNSRVMELDQAQSPTSTSGYP